MSELVRFYNENGRAPQKREFGAKNGFPCSVIYVERFGSWNNALLKINLMPNKQYDYDIEFLKNEIYRFIDENGKVPGKRDFNIKNGYPPYTNYVKKFGSWNNCLVELGVRIVDYTEEILINDLKRFYIEFRRLPLRQEMCSKNGYIPFKKYIDIFGDWENALYQAKLIKYNYTEEILLNALKEFYLSNARSPTITDLNANKEYPPISVYYRKFGSWNNALIAAELPLTQTHESLDGSESCNICGNTKCVQWSIVDKNRVCGRCISGNRYYYHGILDPESHVGFGIIIETVVSIVLNDCKKCNTPDNFNGPYDLISQKYGTINVKSSKLYCRQVSTWQFTIKNSVEIPDNFVVVGLSATKKEILHVWIIPGINNFRNKTGFCFTNSEYGLYRLSEYEVDATPYNKVYQELDIYSLPEFCNYVKLEEVCV